MSAFVLDFKRLLCFAFCAMALGIAPFSARAADFEPMTDIEMRLLSGIKAVPVPDTHAPLSLSYVAAYETSGPASCNANDVAEGCKKALFVFVGIEESSAGYGFYTRPGFGWRVDGVEEWPKGSGTDEFSQGKIITLSEEVRESGLRDPVTKAWPRRISQIATDAEKRILADKFEADVTPLTEWEEKILTSPFRRFPDASDRSRRPKVYDSMPWQIEIYLAENDECATESSDSCKAYTAFAVISDVDGKKFGFHAPMGFAWDIVDIKAYTPNGVPMCAYMTFTEQVRSRSVVRRNGASWPTRKHNICAAPTGFVDAH